MQIINFLEFHCRIRKIIKLNYSMREHENYEVHIIPFQNNEYHENLIIPHQNQENHEIHRIRFQNLEHHEN